MAQHDYIIANQTAAAFRADLNNALAAIVSNNSGPNEPNPTYAYQIWPDTTTGILKRRNGANTAWIPLMRLDGAFLLVPPEDGSITTAKLADGVLTANVAGRAKMADWFVNTAKLAPNCLSADDEGRIRMGDGFLSANTQGRNKMQNKFVTTEKLDDVIAPNVSSLNGGQLAGMRNRIINGAIAIDQRNAGAAQTITAGAALAYTVDRWYAYCTGANVTGQRVQDTSTGLFRYCFSGAAGVTSIGFGQRIEQANSADLAGQVATLSVDLANNISSLTVSWTAFYANTTNTFGTLASPTRTQFATGIFTFAADNTIRRRSAQVTIPAAATTGIEIVFSVGAQTSGTWTIGDVQLEPSSVATPFERRIFGQELALCKRYWQSGSFQTGGTTTSGVGFYGQIFYEVEFRATPTLVFSSVGAVGNFDTAVPAVASVSNAKQVSFLKTATATGSGIYSFNWAGAAEL